MTQRKNFSGQVTPSIVDTEYFQCNFRQPVPIEVAGKKRGVRLFPGNDTPRSFTECSLGNAEPPPGSTLNGCNTAIFEAGVVDSSEDVVVDGVTVGTINITKSIIYGRYINGGYEDKPVPEEIFD